MSALQHRQSAPRAGPGLTKTAGDRAQTSMTPTGTKVDQDPKTRASIVHLPSKPENAHIPDTFPGTVRTPTRTRKPGRGPTNEKKLDLARITKRNPGPSRPNMGNVPFRETAFCQKSSSQTKTV